MNPLYSSHNMVDFPFWLWSGLLTLYVVCLCWVCWFCVFLCLCSLVRQYLFPIFICSSQKIVCSCSSIFGFVGFDVSVFFFVWVHIFRCCIIFFVLTLCFLVSHVCNFLCFPEGICVGCDVLETEHLSKTQTHTHTDMMPRMSRTREAEKIGNTQQL